MEDELCDLRTIHSMEDEPGGGDVHDPTTLLEEKAPTMNNNVVSEAYNARRSFDHHSEYKLYVNPLETWSIYQRSPQPIPRET